MTEKGEVGQDRTEDGEVGQDRTEDGEVGQGSTRQYKALTNLQGRYHAQ